MQRHGETRKEMKKINTPNYEITAYYVMQESGAQIQVNATAHYSGAFYNLSGFMPSQKGVKLTARRVEKEMEFLMRRMQGLVQR